VSVIYLDGSVQSSGISRFTTAGGLVRGIVFNDLNENGKQDEGEAGIPDWPLQVSGRRSARLFTDSLGMFTLSGIDSGKYQLVCNQIHPWKLFLPETNLVAVDLHRGELFGGISFGWAFQWNSIKGRLFIDANANGEPDSGETGLSGWAVHLVGEAGAESTLTDPDGLYRFSHLSTGRYSIAVGTPQNWEQIMPLLQQDYSLDLYRYTLRFGGLDFSLQRIPLRLKLAISVHDSVPSHSRQIKFGVRPGATTGIWGTDPEASNADFSEGEFEIPPQITNAFDVRFENPGNTPAKFGFGSWTDMRAYLSPAQVDTYRISFNPGILSGGGYPMTLKWSKESVRSSYTGSVRLLYSPGTVIDMKLDDSLVIADPDVHVLRLIAGGPILPVDGIRDPESRLPSEFLLEQNYPNPFNPATTIRYELPADGGRSGAALYNVSLKIYDALGQLVSTLVDGDQGPGFNALVWNSGNSASGVYFYRLQATSTGSAGRSYSQVRKLLLLK
jgi:hypothetical protein